ncbi:MAG TPA: hypothetical protein VMS86_02030 [Thermoanaerobaculia bacterium]|nr:hypothetical protein [Thermoanaerobaculia bacterium]
MSSRNQILAALGLCAAFALACGPSQEKVKANARAEEWRAIQADRAALDDLRAQLAAARDRTDVAAEATAGAAPPAEGATDGEAEPSPEATEERELQARVGESTDRFLERLVTFINEHAFFEGEEPAPEVAAAIRMKSSEDQLLAREYIERGGDHAKAIDILQSAKAVDPDNPELEAALAEAERLRYMDRERFSRVSKGMSEAEVRRELGQVKHQNIRKYEDGKVIAWFYPREGGAAAAVFFRPRNGQFKVDAVNFEAVKSAAERAAAGESGEESATD